MVAFFIVAGVVAVLCVVWLWLEEEAPGWARPLVVVLGLIVSGLVLALTETAQNPPW